MNAIQNVRRNVRNIRRVRFTNAFNTTERQLGRVRSFRKAHAEYIKIGALLVGWDAGRGIVYNLGD